jgi:ferric-dicitrate binding protein FerR (iron transport regulator)
VAGIGIWLAVVPAQQLNPIVFLTTQFAEAKQWKTADNRSEITLPDGTKVTLGYNSTLTLAKDFDQEKRNLDLVGEAFFDVAKDAQKPFVVRSKHINTQALGTAFLIEAYPNQVGVKIWLAEGKVQVSDQKSKTKLLPGQSAFGLQEGHIDKEKFDLSTINNWKTDQLLFDNSSFSNVLTQLAMHYGVQFKINKMPQQPLSFTGNLSGQSLEESLEVIAAVNHFSFQVLADQEVEITFE